MRINRYGGHLSELEAQYNTNAPRTLITFSETPRKYSKENTMFCLDLVALRFTIEVMGKTILQVDTATVLPRVKETDKRLEMPTCEPKKGTTPWQTAC